MSELVARIRLRYWLIKYVYYTLTGICMDRAARSAASSQAYWSRVDLSSWTSKSQRRPVYSMCLSKYRRPSSSLTLAAPVQSKLAKKKRKKTLVFSIQLKTNMIHKSNARLLFNNSYITEQEVTVQSYDVLVRKFIVIYYMHATLAPGRDARVYTMDFAVISLNDKFCGLNWTSCTQCVSLFLYKRILYNMCNNIMMSINSFAIWKWKKNRSLTSIPPSKQIYKPSSTIEHAIKIKNKKKSKGFSPC